MILEALLRALDLLLRFLLDLRETTLRGCERQNKKKNLRPFGFGLGWHNHLHRLQLHIGLVLLHQAAWGTDAVASSGEGSSEQPEQGAASGPC